MDNYIMVKELKTGVGLFCNEREWNYFHNPKDLSSRIYDEAKEILECFENPYKSDELSDELADITFNILRFFQKYDVDLASALHEIMDERTTGIDCERNIAELKSIVSQSCGNDHWLKQPYSAARAIIEESEMFVNYFSTMFESESENLFLEREIAVYITDIFAKVLGLAERNEIDLSEAFYRKMEKNKNKYSENKSSGTALKYTML